MSQIVKPAKLANFKGQSKPKPKRRFEDPDHLAFVRELPCLVTEQTPCDAHHILRIPDNSRGGAMRAHDCWVVPLTHLMHMTLHRMGERKFEKHYRLPYLPAVAALLFQLSGNRDACIRALEEMGL